MNKAKTFSISKILKWMIYPILSMIGTLIILLCSLVQNVATPSKGEYYYSKFLLNNYTYLSNTILFLTAFFAGYLFRPNPWLSGLFLFLIFPVTSIIEGSVYPGSHNLIPFEFIMHFVMSLPTIIAVYLGRFARQKVEKQRLVAK